MNAQIKKLTQAFPAFRLRLVDNKRWALMAGVGLAVAATAIIVSVLWTGNRGYVSLYGRQENLPVSQIVTVLDGEKLSYRIDPQSGQILVPEDELSKTRMTLAAKGVQAILPSGYELMDKDEVLGSSQFVQNVRYKRSLEGELAQSIMSLDAVESARVHLALNEESSFVVSDEPQNSASVVVRLHYGAKLNMDQVNAIVHLVSGSIPGLQASKVSVVDQAGNLLTDGIGAGEAVSAATRKRDQILKDIQDKTRASVANVLDSLVGSGNYRVSVMPDLDLSTIDETQEHYGDAPKINREESVLDSDTNQVAMGVPGSLSNRPPVAANQMTNGTEENRSPEALSKHSESKRDYSYDRSVQHIQHPGFAVKRLNVAVVLNQNAPALKNWKPEQTTQLTALLNNAAGIDAQAVGFNRDITYLMPFKQPVGLMAGARVFPEEKAHDILIGESWLGRVVNGLGEPLDGKGRLNGNDLLPPLPPSVNPLTRRSVDEPLDVGVKAINGLLTIGKGQRVGLMAGSGVGKSVLLGMITRQTKADIVVVGLIGERGREVKEFIDHSLGADGLAKSIVVVAPADESPLMRLKATELCHSIAAWFRDRGHHVLLLVDSLTRYAMAQREIALSLGEPPATKGYPPSAFGMIPKLVESAGNSESAGSMTAIYTVLAEGDDQQDPIVDCARAVLDGHIVLTRKLAEAGHYPAIDIGQSISRCMNQVTSLEHQQSARALKQNYAAYMEIKPLIPLGGYVAGADASVDKAVKMFPAIERFLRQEMREPASLELVQSRLQILFPCAKKAEQ
ncbi:flagellar M-ring protein FliF [Escherichia coli]|nr:flagellar M-ring protein FliF [Escherichia coli]